MLKGQALLLVALYLLAVVVNVYEVPPVGGLQPLVQFYSLEFFHGSFVIIQ